MVATIFSFTKARKQQVEPPRLAPAPVPRDWTNQELSDLYRAVSSLGQSGIIVHVDRGLTDEGDPWMVLCRMDGEVFIHFCRLDGQYLLDSPALARPLHGQDFADLIDQFISKASAAAAPNVVAFRASKVFLHPAALLTILVWSLYVWSSDTAQAHEAPGGTGALPEHWTAGAPADGSNAPQAAAKPQVLLDGLPGDRLLGRLLQAMDQSGAMPAGNNAAAMQLLAVVGTLVLTAAMSHELGPADDGATSFVIDTLPPQDLAAGKPIDFVDFDDASAQSVWDGSTTFKALLAAAAPADDLLLPSPDLVQLEATASVQMSDLPEAPLAPLPLRTPIVRSDAAPALPASIAAHPVADAQVDLPSIVLNNSFAALVGTGFTLASYAVNGVDLLASFDVAATQNLQIVGEADAGGDVVIEAPQLDSEPTGLSQSTYNDAARAFINFFLSQSDDIEVVASATELVLIDLSAFDDTMDRAYSYSWSLEDGGTISTVGHYDLFASHALV